MAPSPADRDVAGAASHRPQSLTVGRSQAAASPPTGGGPRRIATWGAHERLCGEGADDQVAEHRAVVLAPGGIEQVAAEEGTEGVAVGHPEEAEGADHH